MTTTDDKRGKVVERIRKLLALADPERGGTPAEVEQAQRRAAELMTRHQIAVIDLDDADRGPVGEDDETIDGMTEMWRGQLSGAIAKAMGGDWYYTPRSRTRRTFHIVGRPEVLAFARTLTDALIPYLEVECETALTAALASGTETGICSRCDGVGETRRMKGGGYAPWAQTCPTCGGEGTVPLSPRVFRRSFYEAATGRIAARLRAQRRDTAGAKSTDLVRSDRASIDRYYEQRGMVFASSSSRSSGGAIGGAVAGQSAGNAASLRPSSGVTAGRGALPRGGAR